MRPSRRLAVAAATMLTLVLVPAGLAAGPADARASAARGNALSPGRLANIALSEVGSFARAQTQLRATETSHPQLGIGNVDTVLASGARRTRPACHPSVLTIATTWRASCWAETDDAGRSWYPQGITGSGDASGRTPLFTACTGCPPHKVVAVSWHNTGDTLAKVSFLDVTSSMTDAPYDEALLVVPAAGQAGFHALPSHASGIAWYGRYLYLFSNGTTVVQVFDVRRIWAMNAPAGGGVGCDGAGQCSAATMRFALPRVGYYRFADGFPCWSRLGLEPCFSSVSLDRATVPDTLVTTEYNAKAGGRVVRWPLDARTGRLRPAVTGKPVVVPVAGWRSPLRRQQGAVLYGRNGFASAACPPGVSATPAPLDPAQALPEGPSASCLYRVRLSSGRPDARLSAAPWTVAPRGLQNLAYWPTTGELWTQNEFAGTSTLNGNRQLIAVDCPRLLCL
jgi:hypothetical protein